MLSVKQMIASYVNFSASPNYSIHIACLNSRLLISADMSDSVK